MIKVALEDALMKLKDHFHGEKHSQQGCFSSRNTNKANKEKSIYKKNTQPAASVQKNDNSFHCGTTACLQGRKYFDGT